MHVIDINASIGKRVSEDARHGIRALSEELDRHRVACAVVHHGEAVFYRQDEGNRLACEAAADRRFVPAAVLDLRDSTRLWPELERCLARTVRVFRFFPTQHEYSFRGRLFGEVVERFAGSAKVRRLMAEVAKRGRPVLFMPHAPEDAPAERELAREFPTLPIVHAHAFDADWAAVVKDAPNVHVEFCLSRPSHRDVRDVLDILGPERVLFGSDQTLLSLGAAVGLYLDARMSDRERTLVLSGNARRLYGIAG